MYTNCLNNTQVKGSTSRNIVSIVKTSWHCELIDNTKEYIDIIWNELLYS